MHEDRLRAILPFLRPRTEEPTGLMLLLVAILFLGIASLVALHIWRRRIQHLRMQARFAKLATEKTSIRRKRPTWRNWPGRVA